jgi:hypothetical protein
MIQASERHPAPSEIVAFANGELSPSEHARIGAHVDACERCTAVKEAVVETAKKFKVSEATPTPGEVHREAEKPSLSLSPEHERLLTKLASPASLKTLAGELHLSVARLSRQVREAREFICDHNPRLLQKSSRALESSLGSDDDGDQAAGADAKTAFAASLDRGASEAYLARRFGAVNVGIYRAVYSADDDAEWERFLEALLSDHAASESDAPPAQVTAVTATLPAVATNEANDPSESGLRAEVDVQERVERPADIDISQEVSAAAKARRARGRR